jgi:hypothetical protein
MKSVDTEYPALVCFKFYCEVCGLICELRTYTVTVAECALFRDSEHASFFDPDVELMFVSQNKSNQNFQASISGE